MTVDKKLIELWEKDGEIIAGYYQKKINECGFNSQGLGERSATKDFRFYDGLFGGLEFKNTISVLDIGCGMGDLIPYLDRRKIAVKRYLGVDIAGEFVEFCKKRYPKCLFKKINFVSENFNPSLKFDLVISAGGLVSGVSSYEKYLEYSIRKMIGMANNHVLLNLISDIDELSLNYSNRNKAGGITSISENRLFAILSSIKKEIKIDFSMEKEKIYPDAVEVFIKIKLI